MQENQQLIKRDIQTGGYNNIYPNTYIDLVSDRANGMPLNEIISGYNSYFVPWAYSVQETRLQVPSSVRRKGLFLTYVNPEDTVVIEWYNSDNIDDNSFQSDENWNKASTAEVNADSLNPEDLSIEKSKLQFADRQYNPKAFSGKAYKILRKNLVIVQGVTKNILDQSMIDSANTIYVIRYDFDLNDSTITIPEGCILDFQGGSFNNGIVVGNLNVRSDKTCFYNVNFDSATITDEIIQYKYFYNENEQEDTFQKVIDLAIINRKNIDLNGLSLTIGKTINIDRKIDGIYKEYFVISNGTLVIEENTNCFSTRIENNYPVSQLLKLENVKFITSNENNIASYLLYRNKLLRVAINNCDFIGVKLLMMPVNGNGDFVQSIYVNNCNIRNVRGIWCECYGTLIDCRFTGNIVEHFNGINDSDSVWILADNQEPLDTRATNRIWIINNLVEFVDTAIIVSKAALLLVRDNYFENKKTDIISLSSEIPDMIISITGNTFYGDTSIYRIKLNAAYQAIVTNNMSIGSLVFAPSKSICNLKAIDNYVIGDESSNSSVFNPLVVKGGESTPTEVTLGPNTPVYPGTLICNNNIRKTNLTSLNWALQLCTKFGISSAATFQKLWSFECVPTFSGKEGEDLNLYRAWGMYGPDLPDGDVTKWGGNTKNSPVQYPFILNVYGTLSQTFQSLSVIDSGSIAEYSNQREYIRSWNSYTNKWSEWKELVTINSGTTEQRPKLGDGGRAGFIYFDTILNKCIVWNGTSWINLDGSPLM